MQNGLCFEALFFSTSILSLSNAYMGSKINFPSWMDLANQDYITLCINFLIDQIALTNKINSSCNARDYLAG